MNIVILTGSISEQSNNKKIARWFEAQYGEQADITHFPLKSIPMYNQDIEDDPPEAIHEMRRLFDAADGVVMIAPEYNHSMPGVLKNLLDWASRGVRALKDKPVYLVGGSTGRFGTLRSQIHLLQILNSPGVGADVFPTQVQVAHVDRQFTPDGECTDADTEKYLRRGMDAFLASLA
ncbi:MAG: NADPH-dependent FMN reductase [Saccharofermentanales bacterium]|jgi:chromate reductase